jgi:hypothetical protein
VEPHKRILTTLVGPWKHPTTIRGDGGRRDCVPAQLRKPFD